MPIMDDLDLVNRDPNDLNEHVKVAFEDVLAEPAGGHSIDCCWKASNCCFNCCKGCCYKLMTFFCAIPLSIMWGCEFAFITFWHVWYYTPTVRKCMINCGSCQKMYGICIHCFLQPCCEACGFCFYNIRITKETK